MDLEGLRAKLEDFIKALKPENEKALHARLSSLKSVFPFSEYEYILMFLRDRNVIGFNEYEKLRTGYTESNKYLDLYDLSPRIFGQIWAEQHLRDIDLRFQKPNRLLDPDFEGQYDLWCEGIKVETKTSRAANEKIRGPIRSKALRSTSKESFWMNFQQIKVDYCDVFVFIGVWVDDIRYWVMSSTEVKVSPYLSHQHAGGIEQQLGLTDKNLQEFRKYLVEPRDMVSKVLEAASK